MVRHVVMLHEGAVIGSLLRIVRRIKIRDLTVTAQFGVDSSLVPRFQGRGFFGLMNQHSFERAARQKVALQLYLGGHPATAHVWVKRGIVHPRNKLRVLFLPIATMRAAARVEGRSASLPRVLVASGIRVKAIGSRIRHGRSRPPDGGSAVETIEEFDDSADDFWESASQDFDFIPVRDRAYLNWRYCDRRGGEFTVRAQRDDAQLLGYCVLKSVAGRAYIADLLARSGRLDVVERLLWDAVSFARARGTDGIICQLPGGHPYRRTILRTGFLDTGRSLDVGVISLAGEPERLDFLNRRDSRIHITQGDSDRI